MTTTISFGKNSRIGKRKNNEDAAEIVTRPNAAMLVVADGLGGHSGGEIASLGGRFPSGTGDAGARRGLRQQRRLPQP